MGVSVSQGVVEAGGGVVGVWVWPVVVLVEGGEVGVSVSQGVVEAGGGVVGVLVLPVVVLVEGGEVGAVSYTHLTLPTTPYV